MIYKGNVDDHRPVHVEKDLAEKHEDKGHGDARVDEGKSSENERSRHE